MFSSAPSRFAAIAGDARVSVAAKTDDLLNLARSRAPADRERLTSFFAAFAFQAQRILVPGGHLVIASNPLVSSTTFAAIET